MRDDVTRELSDCEACIRYNVGRRGYNAAG